jgi:hypothetical protein
VREAAVANVGLRRAHEAFADVAVPGTKSTNEEQVDAQVEIARHGWRRDREVRGEPRVIEWTALFRDRGGDDLGSSARWHNRSAQRDAA